MIKITFPFKQYKFKSNQAVLFLLALLCSVALFSQNMTYNITDPEQLDVRTYQAGDVIILQDGIYDSDDRIDFDGNGTEENPILFRPQTPGGVKFTGGLKMDIGGDYVIIDGFHWEGGYGASNFIQFRNGSDYANHSTIQNCVINGLGVEDSELQEDLADEQITKHRWIVLYGTYNTVINCTFMNKVTAGAIVLGEYSYNAFPDGDSGVNNSCLEVGHKIMNNYFYNYEKLTEKYGRKANGDELSNAGDCETIRLGASSYQMVNSNAIVSNNYFVQSDGENEIITNKSKGNIYTNNTFRRSRGSLVLRHGSKAIVDRNYFLGEGVDGTGGIRVTDSEHVITNNYIQDCITVEDFAKWNNGITFIGGNANHDVDCSSDDVSNGYQKTENIKISNNSIVNTNAPLFYNTDKGSTDPTGTIEDNLIYFDASYPTEDLTPVISGDTDTAYADMGTTLTYTGNVYTGTILGEINAGFSEDNGITAAADGEIFTFSGATGKGADMGVNRPIDDSMVGQGIGACFLDFEGKLITNPSCTIEASEYLTVGSLETLAPEAGSYDVNVNANVGWTATSNDAWITTITPNSGSGSETVSISVTTNTVTTERVGTVTFTQDPGGDNIVRTLTVTQEEADPRTGLNLINVNASDVAAVYACHEEIPPSHSKNNPKENSLDKATNTQWAGSAALGECADYVSIIYDLKGAFDLDLVDIATTSGKTYNLQVWVSPVVPVSPATYPDDDDFTLVYPNSGFETISTNPDTFVPFILPTSALGTRFVKIVGDGQTSGSRYTTIHEIEFYGARSLSVDELDLNTVSIFPVPAKNILNIKTSGIGINQTHVYSLDGRHVLSKVENTPKSEISLDVSSLSNGTYLINFSNKNGLSASKMIMVAH